MASTIPPTAPASPSPSSAPSDPPTLPAPDPQPNLPDPTTWLIGLLLSWLAFGLVIAVMLLMAQFPETFPWWAEIADVPRARKKRDDRARVGERERGVRGVSSAVDEVHGERGGGAGRRVGEGFRLRKPRGLSVDTHSKARGPGGRGGGGGREGLGILLPHDDNGDRAKLAVEKKVKKRVSFDPSTSTSSTRKNPPCQSWEAATAPLPQTKTFLQTLDPADDDDDDDDGDEILRCPDIETGHPMPNSRDLGDHYAERRASPYFKVEATDAANEEDEKERKTGGWLGRVNQGVYMVADRVAMKFYDKVNGAEEGLLLPVRETEREGWMGREVD